MKKLTNFIFSFCITFLLVSCSDDDPKKVLPNVSVDDVTVSEGSELLFTISISETSTDTVTISYRTENVTTADNDYFPVSTALKVKIMPGETSVKVGISTRTDALVETEETLMLLLVDAKNAVILDKEGTGVIKNIVQQVVTHFMKAKIVAQQWTAKIGGFFGAAFIGNTFAGYGTDNDSQLSFVFYNEPTGPKTYGIEELGATNDTNVSIYYSPKFFSSGGLGQTFNGEPGGKLVITKYDITNKIAEGTFTFTAKDKDGNKVEVTEGSFKVPIE